MHRIDAGSGSVRLTCLAGVIAALCVAAVAIVPGTQYGASAGNPVQQPAIASGILRGDVLNAVSCPSPRGCLAVGTGALGPTPFIILLKGGKVSVLKAPHPVGSTEVDLNGISCLSTSFCVVVGHSVNRLGVFSALAETLSSGRWRLDALPGSGPWASLGSVSCVTTTFCVAGGQRDLNKNPGEAIAEVFAHGKWTVWRHAGFKGGIAAMSCTSLKFCLAGGRTATTAYAEIWNGETWKSFTPRVPVAVYDIDGVSCFGAQHCVALGYPELPELLNGNVWRALTVPSLKLLFTGVSCTSATFCMTAGVHSGANVVAARLVKKQWTLWYLPGTLVGDFAISQAGGVSCSSDTQCLLVGQTSNASESYAFVDSFNGRKWSVIDR